MLKLGLASPETNNFRSRYQHTEYKCINHLSQFPILISTNGIILIWYKVSHEHRIRYICIYIYCSFNYITSCAAIIIKSLQSSMHTRLLPHTFLAIGIRMNGICREELYVLDRSVIWICGRSIGPWLMERPLTVEQRKREQKTLPSKFCQSFSFGCDGRKIRMFSPLLINWMLCL